MIRFDLTSEEALYLLSENRQDEQINQLLIKDRPNDCTFNGTIKGFGGKEVMFYCKGDELGYIYVLEVKRVKSGYVLEYWADSFKRTPPDNRSYSQDRLTFNDYTGWVEKAYHDAWAEENAEEQNRRDMLGFLQQFMCGKSEFQDKYLTNRERRIVATAIQWLGSSCGRGFLHEANRKLEEKLATNKKQDIL